MKIKDMTIGKTYSFLWKRTTDVRMIQLCIDSDISPIGIGTFLGIDSTFSNRLNMEIRRRESSLMVVCSAVLPQAVLEEIEIEEEREQNAE